MLTFILVPTFAISAFVVGVFPAAYAAPLPPDPRDPAMIVERGCRQPGCLFVQPSTTSASSSNPVATATSASAAATGSPASGTEASNTAENPPDPIQAVARAVGAATLVYTDVFSVERMRN